MKQRIALLFLFFSLNAQDPLFVVDSGHAQAAREKMLFTDPVHVQVRFGDLSAKKMEMGLGANLVQYNHLILDEDVSVNFKDGGFLRCSHAEIYGDELKGELWGTEELLATYFNEKKGAIKIQAEKIGVQFVKEEQFFLNSLNADRFVRVDFLHDLSMRADHAVYERHSKVDAERAPKHLPGVIFLEGNCRITNKHEDKIKAEQVRYDMVQRKLFVKAPVGDFRLKKRGLLTFTAGSLLWDRLSQKMTLLDHIVLNIDELSSLVAEEKVFFYYDEGEDIRKIESHGETLLTLRDRKKLSECTLGCFGKVLYDRSNGVVYLEGPLNPSGTILKDQQVFFQDSTMRIVSDRMHVSFRRNEQEKLVPMRFILEGNVHYVSRLEEEGGPLQFAMADRVEFHLQNKELLFSSSKEQPVLYLDKGNNFQVSATALKLKKSTPAQKGYIQGIGNMRFRFAKKEAEVMENFFVGVN